MSFIFILLLFLAVFSQDDSGVLYDKIATCQNGSEITCFCEVLCYSNGTCVEVGGSCAVCNAISPSQCSFQLNEKGVDHCFGTPANDPSACGDFGTCVYEDICECHNIFFYGEECNFFIIQFWDDFVWDVLFVERHLETLIVCLIIIFFIFIIAVFCCYCMRGRATIKKELDHVSKSQDEVEDLQTMFLVLKEVIKKYSLGSNVSNVVDQDRMKEYEKEIMYSKHKNVQVMYAIVLNLFLTVLKIIGPSIFNKVEIDSFSKKITDKLDAIEDSLEEMKDKIDSEKMSVIEKELNEIYKLVLTKEEQNKNTSTMVEKFGAFRKKFLGNLLKDTHREREVFEKYVKNIVDKKNSTDYQKLSSLKELVYVKSFSKRIREIHKKKSKVPMLAAEKKMIKKLLKKMKDANKKFLSVRDFQDDEKKSLLKNELEVDLKKDNALKKYIKTIKKKSKGLIKETIIRIDFESEYEIKEFSDISLKRSNFLNFDVKEIELSSRKKVQNLQEQREETVQKKAEFYCSKIEGFISKNEDWNVNYWANQFTKFLRENFFAVDTPLYLVMQFIKILETLLKRDENNVKIVIIPCLKALHGILRIALYMQKDTSILMGKEQKKKLFDLIDEIGGKFEGDLFLQYEIECIVECVKIIRDNGNTWQELIDTMKLLDFTGILNLTKEKWTLIIKGKTQLIWTSWYKDYFLNKVSTNSGHFDKLKFELVYSEMFRRKIHKILYNYSHHKLDIEYVEHLSEFCLIILNKANNYQPVFFNVGKEITELKEALHKNEHFKALSKEDKDAFLKKIDLNSYFFFNYVSCLPQISPGKDIKNLDQKRVEFSYKGDSINYEDIKFNEDFDPVTEVFECIDRLEQYSNVGKHAEKEDKEVDIELEEENIEDKTKTSEVIVIDEKKKEEKKEKRQKMKDLDSDSDEGSDLENDLDGKDDASSDESGDDDIDELLAKNKEFVREEIIVIEDPKETLSSSSNANKSIRKRHKSQREIFEEIEQKFKIRLELMIELQKVNKLFLLLFGEFWNKINEIMRASKKEVVLLKVIENYALIFSKINQKKKEWNSLRSHFEKKKNKKLVEYIEKSIIVTTKFYSYTKFVEEVISSISFLDLKLDLKTRPLSTFSTDDGKMYDIEWFYKKVEKSKFVFLHANAGSGKSCVGRHVNHYFTESELGLFPLYIKADILSNHLKKWNFSASVEDKVFILEESLINSHFEDITTAFTSTEISELRTELKQIIRTENLMLIIDGVDEIAEIKRNAFINFLKFLFIENNIQISKLFMSGRPEIVDAPEFRSVLSKFEIFHLDKLTKKNTITLIENVLRNNEIEGESIVDRFLNLKIENDGNPLITILLLKRLLNTEKEDDRELTSSFLVYEKILISTLVENKKKRKEMKIAQCSDIWIMNCLSVIAYIVHRTNKQEKNNLIFTLNKYVEHVIGNELWLKSIVNPVETIINSISSFSGFCSLQNDIVTFQHRSIQEFLCSRFICNQEKNVHLNRLLQEFAKDESIYFSFSFKQARFIKVYEFCNQVLCNPFNNIFHLLSIKSVFADMVVKNYEISEKILKKNLEKVNRSEEEGMYSKLMEIVKSKNDIEVRLRELVSFFEIPFKKTINRMINVVINSFDFNSLDFDLICTCLNVFFDFNMVDVLLFLKPFNIYPIFGNQLSKRKVVHEQNGKIFLSRYNSSSNQLHFFNNSYLYFGKINTTTKQYVHSEPPLSLQFSFGFSDKFVLPFHKDYVLVCDKIFKKSGELLLQFRLPKAKISHVFVGSSMSKKKEWSLFVAYVSETTKKDKSIKFTVVSILEDIESKALTVESIKEYKNEASYDKVSILSNWLFFGYSKDNSWCAFHLQEKLFFTECTLYNVEEELKDEANNYFEEGLPFFFVNERYLVFVKNNILLFFKPSYLRETKDEKKTKYMQINYCETYSHSSRITDMCETISSSSNRNDLIVVFQDVFRNFCFLDSDKNLMAVVPWGGFIQQGNRGHKIQEIKFIVDEKRNIYGSFFDKTLNKTQIFTYVPYTKEEDVLERDYKIVKKFNFNIDFFRNRYQSYMSGFEVDRINFRKYDSRGDVFYSHRSEKVFVVSYEEKINVYSVFDQLTRVEKVALDPYLDSLKYLLYEEENGRMSIWCIDMSDVDHGNDSDDEDASDRKCYCSSYYFEDIKSKRWKEHFSLDTPIADLNIHSLTKINNDIYLVRSKLRTSKHMGCAFVKLGKVLKNEYRRTELYNHMENTYDVFLINSKNKGICLNWILSAPNKDGDKKKNSFEVCEFSFEFETKKLIGEMKVMFKIDSLFEVTEARFLNKRYVLLNNSVIFDLVERTIDVFLSKGYRTQWFLLDGLTSRFAEFSKVKFNIRDIIKKRLSNKEVYLKRIIKLLKKDEEKEKDKLKAKELNYNFEFYSNGLVKESGIWDENKRLHGPGRQFHDNGALEQEGTYKHGKLISGKEFHDNGSVEYDGEMLDGRRHGKGTLYFDSGAKKYIGLFVNGYKEGKGERWYDNGKLKYVGEFKKGDRHGKGTLFDVEGKKVITGNWVENFYEKKKGKVYVEYVRDRRTKKVFVEYEGGMLNGRYAGEGKEYHSTGKVKYEGKQVKGRKEGKGTEYYKYGGLSYVGTFVKDEYCGKGIKYYRNYFDDPKTQMINRKEFEGTFKGDEIVLGKNYYNLGDKQKKDGDDVLKYEGEFDDGEEYYGKGKFYYESGKLKYEGEFKANKFNGKGILYDETGNVTSKGLFKKGKFIEEDK